ncbi:uncharacterized protein K02A2.6-like [Anopheles funestus]|uniref:uncharacterized protein K02A2.6-like n=1 Tax=Anopheles funestus TaxID=62324 RepID=UPI0020C64625|nr:uncharacterized protein K02A2.6-like [Anopheles funestus]
MILQDFDFDVEHRSGEKLRHVGCLSRYPEQNVMIISEVTARMKKHQVNDETLIAIIEVLKEKPYGSYKMKGDILYNTVDGNDLLVIPKNMEKKIILDAHNMGHFACAKTVHSINQQYFIPHVDQKVKQVIDSFVRYIMHNNKLGKKEGFLNPIDKGNSPLQTIHLDHIGPMDITIKQYKQILTVVDAFSKFVWLYPTKSTDAEEVIAKLQSWSEIFGDPQRIITDRGTAFTSNSFADYVKNRQIEHVVNTTGVPRGKGQAERVNRVVLSTLAKLSSKEPSKWYKSVGLVQRALNSHWHATTKQTPFHTMFGVTMRNGDADYLRKIIDAEMYEFFENGRSLMREKVRNEIEKAQIMHKKNYDKSRKVAVGYKVGDLYKTN